MLQHSTIYLPGKLSPPLNRGLPGTFHPGSLPKLKLPPSIYEYGIYLMPFYENFWCKNEVFKLVCTKRIHYLYCFSPKGNIYFHPCL